MKAIRRTARTQSIITDALALVESLDNLTYQSPRIEEVKKLLQEEVELLESSLQSHFK